MLENLCLFIMHACQHAYFNNSEVHRFYLSRLVQYQLCQRRLWGPGPQEVGERGKPCLMLQCHHQNNSVLRGTKPTMQVQFCVKGDRTNNASWPENRKCAMWKYHLQATFGSSVTIYAKEVLFFYSKCSSSVCSHFESLFLCGEQKRVDWWCLSYFCHTVWPCL